jgi:hypothetical protein
MSARAWLTTARYGVTALLAGLTAAYGYYPSVKLLPIAIAVVGTLGIHAVPSAVQAAFPPRVVMPVFPTEQGTGGTSGS